MKYKELTGKKTDDLLSHKEKLLKELSQLLMDVRMGRSNKTSKIGLLKKDIARTLTAQRQQELRESK